MPAPQYSVTFSSQVEALRAQDAERTRREERMRNALETLDSAHWTKFPNEEQFARFVRATAREGLGRDAAA